MRHLCVERICTRICVERKASEIAAINFRTDSNYEQHTYHSIVIFLNLYIYAKFIQCRRAYVCVRVYEFMVFSLDYLLLFIVKTTTLQLPTLRVVVPSTCNPCER